MFNIFNINYKNVNYKCFSIICMIKIKITKLCLLFIRYVDRKKSMNKE